VGFSICIKAKKLYFTFFYVGIDRPTKLLHSTFHSYPHFWLLRIVMGWAHFAKQHRLVIVVVVVASNLGLLFFSSS